MKMIRIISFFIATLSMHLVFGQTERTTDAAEVSMTISNIGIFGNAFKGSYPDNPSCKCSTPELLGYLQEGLSG